MKKLVTFFLALVMPIMLWAYDFQSGDLYYNITSNVAPYTVEVTSGIDYSGDITIPSSVTYNGITYAVTSIEYYAFYGCSSLTSVTIPNSVTSIGSNAFRNCSSLTSITIPNSVTSIGWSAFEGCSSLTSVTIPNSVTSIESNAFYNTGIFNDNSNWENEVLYISNCLVAAKESLSGAYTIKNGTRIIADYVFYNCTSLTSVTIPNSVTSIGDDVFSHCSSLTSVTIPSSVTSIGWDAFWYCSSLTSVTIPNSVTRIGYGAFQDCSSLTSVTIPNSVTSIVSNAFRDCSSLTSVTIPNSVTRIEDGAFSGCSSLTSVTIPNSVTRIGTAAFDGCSSLTSVTIPSSVTSIGMCAFRDCSSLTSVTIPNSVTSIGYGAFEDCSFLNTIYVEATTPPALGDSTFAETLSPICHIPCGTKAAYEASAWASQVSEFVEECEEGRQIIYTSTDGNIVNPNKIDVFGANIVSNTYENGQGVITFDGPVTSIGASAFSHCFSLNSITIPNSVTSIGSSAFQHCNSLTSVTIGNSVTSIGSSAFYNCSSLTSLTIPNSVTSIIENAFSSCSSLTSIVVEASNTTFDSRENCNAIIETETNTLIAGCQRTIIPNSITRIGDFAFYNCFSLTSITIPNSVINIGNNAFRSCSSLASITIPNSVTSIGQETFCDCSSLTSVTIGNSVKNIGGAAFFNCTKLTSITIPQGVTTIGVSAFHCCSSLASIIVEEGNTTYDSRNNCNAIIETATNTLIVGCQNTIIPNSVTSIVPSAFSWCTSLISIAIPDGVTSIGNNTFYSCFSLASVSIPSSVTSIGNDAFNHCSSLSSITIPNSVTNIGNDAFRSCSSLASITIPNSVTSIGEGTFAGCSSLISVTIGNSVTSIGRLAFYSCSSIDTIHVEATTPPTVDVEAFLSTSISTCYIPCGTLAAYQASDWANYVGEFVEECEEGRQIIYTSTDGNVVTPYDANAFGANIIRNTYKDGVGTIIFDAPVTSLGDLAFHQCSSLVSVTIPNTVTSIGDRAFWNCSSLSSITIPNGVESIGESAFYYCSSLNAITLPNSVKTIGRDAFGYCSSLKKTNYIGDVIDWCDIVFITRETNPIYYSKSFYINDQEVKDLVIPNEVDSIHDYAFENCQSITSLTIGDGVKYVGTEAFSGCFSLKDVKMGKNIVDIGKQAFLSCTSLTVINIPTSVKTIGYQAFSHCTSLTEVEIPNGVTTIGHMAFNMCGSIVSVSLPKSLTSLGRIVFYECNSISKITVEEGNAKYDSRGNCNAVIETATNTLLVGSASTIIPEGIISIETAAFRGLQALTSINIPNSVTNIGEDAFYGCPLTSITIPQNVTNIGELAFRACWSLETIYVEASTPPTIGNNAFEANSPTCYIPCGTKAAYEASDWVNYVGEFVETYEYTLTLSSSDNSMGSATISQEPACGTPAIIIATPNDGYLFSQWSDGNTDNPRTLTVTEDIKLTAQWTPNTNIPYIVNHYRQALDGTYPSTLKETENLMGTTAANVTPVVKTYTGFTSPEAKTATIAADGSTVVEYYYTRNQYTLTWVTDGNALTGAYSKGSVLFETAITIPNTPTKTGYTFAGWDNTVPETMPATDKTFTATWTPNTNTPYVVKHYRQALDGTYPSALMETDNLTGTTATNVTPLVKTYTGFTSPVAKTATIAADGSTVVEYYYTRNQYTLTWVTDGNALTGAYSKGSVLFETAITIPNTPTKTGYTFVGWDKDIPTMMPAENLTLTALFTIHTYSVILTADQNGIVSGGGTYNYGESVTITATPNDGYTFSQWSDGNTDNPRTLTVTEDIELTAEFEKEGNYGSYTRTVRIGYNTICLPHGSSHFTGATFYEIAHILKNDKKIFFDEAKTLEAGKPYIFYPHSTEVTIYYDNTTSAIPLSHNGLHGTFDGITAASNFLKGKYLVAGNRMILCGDGCSLAANRAYIVLDEISDKDHPAIPGIKRVSMDYSEENATTALDNITDESIVAPMQEGVYDILGRKVDAPTVSGFYIINGKKVFVMEK